MDMRGLKFASRFAVSLFAAHCLWLQTANAGDQNAPEAQVSPTASAAPSASGTPESTASPASTATPSETPEASPSEQPESTGTPVASIGSDSTANGLKLVALLHLTGDFAAEGNAFREGIDIAADEYNLQTGPNHVKVSVSFEDTKYDAMATSTAVASFIADERVSGVIISTLHEVKPVAQKLETAKLPTIILWDSSKEIEDLGDYFFGIGPWTSDSGRKAADFALKTLKSKSAFILSTNNEWSASVSKAFFDQAQKTGIVVKGSTSVNPEDKDFLAVINRIRTTGDDSVVYAPLTSSLLTFGKQVHSSALDLPVIMSDAISPSLLAQSRGAFEGFYHTMMADPEGPASTNLKRLYTAKYDKEPGMLMFTALGYDSLRMMVEAAEKTSATREGVKNGLYQIKDMDGASGKITVNDKGSAPKFVSLYQIVEGKFKLVEAADGHSLP